MATKPGSGDRRPAARHLVVLLVFCCRLVQTILRMAMGAVVVYVCEDYGCGPAAKGWLLSAHAFGYCTTQVLGGVLADRAGGKGVVTGALAAAGATLALTPVAAAAFGLWGVALAQLLMGAAMGPLFPASMQMMARWLPAGERAFASTALDTGITLGSLIAVPLSSALAVQFGWCAALLIYGLLAVAFSAAWAALAAERPESCSYCSGEEQAFLQRALPQAKKPAAADMEALLEGLRHARLWAIYAAHFTFNYSVYFISSWSATYYMEVFGLRPERAGLHLSLPHAVNMLVKVFGSPLLARFLGACGASELARRRVFTGLGFVVPALCLRMVPGCRTPVEATACFCAALGFMALHPSGFKANYMDVTTTRGGVVSGIGNTIASVASSVGPLWVSQIRASTGSWAPVFDSIARLNILATLIYCTLSSTTPIEQDAVDEQEGWLDRWRRSSGARAPLGRALRRLARGCGGPRLPLAGASPLRPARPHRVCILATKPVRHSEVHGGKDGCGTA